MRLIIIAVLLGFLIPNCVATGPKLIEVGWKIPPLAADQGRIYFYRLPAFEGSGVWPKVHLDGVIIGKATPGGVFVKDVIPGKHIVSTKAVFENEMILPIEIGKGDIKYVRMGYEPGLWTAQVRPILVDPEIGKHEIKSLVLLYDEAEP